MINNSVSNYSNIENGSYIPPLEDMIVLEKKFNQRIDWQDDLTMRDKAQINLSLETLFALYPVNSVLVYALRAIKEGVRLGHTTLLLKNYADIATSIDHEVDPLLPPRETKRNV